MKRAIKGNFSCFYKHCEKWIYTHKSYVNVVILCYFFVFTGYVSCSYIFPWHCCHVFIVPLFAMPFSQYDTSNNPSFINMWKYFLHVLLFWRYRQWKSVKFIWITLYKLDGKWISINISVILSDSTGIIFSEDLPKIITSMS